jgi:hypothetical protein
MSVRFYCDGGSCKRQLEGDELNNAANVAREAQKADLFCPVCREFAPEYWIELDDVVRRTAEQTANTIRKHRDRFFADKRRKPKLEALTGGRK